jgi:hypothetical protein
VGAACILAALHIDYEHEDNDTVNAQAYVGAVLFAEALADLAFIRRAHTKQD